NRLKNLVVAAGGAYLSPDFTDFDAAGAADIASLIAARSAAGGGPVVLACGSLGTKICWSLADNAETRNRLSGLVVLGGFPDGNFLRAAYSGAVKPVPVYIAHGSRDPVYALEDMEDFYGALNVKSYPVRMTVFDTGNHGTPVRMIDWRSAINWLLAAGTRS
ncbi:MAG: alpha/beta hydrolase, partial [Nitratireductor sp.]|nr:alpha/beta hydrolase [Nitratireductor sp.]